MSLMVRTEFSRPCFFQPPVFPPHGPGFRPLAISPGISARPSDVRSFFECFVCQQAPFFFFSLSLLFPILFLSRLIPSSSFFHTLSDCSGLLLRQVTKAFFVNNATNTLPVQIFSFYPCTQSRLSLPAVYNPPPLKSYNKHHACHTKECCLQGRRKS